MVHKSCGPQKSGKGEKVKRGLTVAVTGAAILVAGISGCSNKPSSGGVATSVPGGSVSVGGANKAKVIIDGKDQNVQGTTVCTKAAGNVSIAVGGNSTGISVVLTDANPPAVSAVQLGNVNGVTLQYAQGGQGNASVTMDGNTYKITGTATGVDMANPTQPVNKPFEIDATCS
jgi:lipoprotein LpqH